MSQAGSFNQSITPPIPGIVSTLTGNSGGAVSPDGAGNIDVLGGNNITTTGNPGTSTLTIDVTGTTDNSLLLGNASGSLSSLGVATDGQLPIGSTGSAPVLATLTAGTNITITNGPGTITIDAIPSSMVINYVTVTNAASPYVVLSTDYYIAADVTAGVVILLFPNAPTTGRIFAVKDMIGNCSANNIIVTTVGGAVLIDGSTSFVMNTDYEAVNLIFNGSAYEIY